MAGFSFDLYDPHNTIAVSALKTGLRGSAALSRIQPSLESTLEAAFNRQCINDWNAEQPTYVSAAKIMHRIVGTLNARIILGEELASDPRTLDAALQYTLDGPIAAQFLRQIPCFLHGPVSSLIIGWTGAQRTLIKQIRRTVQERLSLPRSEDIKVQPTDCIQWIIEVEKKMEGKLLNVEEISKRTLSLLFGAAHQAPVYCTFVLYCLAKYPEYLQPLREEASSFPTADLYGLGGRQTPLLDSFLKETGRLFPIQASKTLSKAVKVLHIH
ncbi:MAG: hypothetical protein M1820_010805 [Bogoriella megaspora]|nr:MAG: hypothetical protein M1820_010805 [Bogoriella megaspora]